MFRVSTKLHLITAIAILAIVSVAGTLLFVTRANMMQEKRMATRAIVDTAYSIVESYEAQVRAGRLSEPAAKASALFALRAIRFGQQDYVWVNDMHPNVIMHPVKPELEGHDASGIKDPKGNALFVEFVQVVRQQGAGFVEYQWPKPGLPEPVDKISYVRGFAPWGWVIGSGIYVDDVAAAFRVSVVRTSALGLAAGALVAFLAWTLARGITRRLGQAVDIAARVAEGDLTTKIEVDAHDEIGEVLSALKRMDDELVRLVTRVLHGTDAIATASNQIAAGNQDLSARTEEQAASLEQTAASMDQLTSTVQNNAASARQANALAHSATAVAEKGGEVVSQVVHTMSSINESSRKVADIIGVIDAIAFQTNILALNAAVEAARAGEQGRGFAVVAAEVRNLAQRSAAAAKEIKALIEASVSKVDSGSALVTQAGETMQDVVVSIRNVTGIMAEISQASDEQTRGIEQVDKAVAQMDRTTQQNAALVEQAAAAAASLRDQAHELVRAVSVFKMPDAGAAAPTAARSSGTRLPAPIVTTALAAPSLVS